MFVEERKETVLHDNWVIVFDCFSFSLFLFFFPSKLLPPCRPVNVRSVGSRIVARLEFGGFGWSLLPSCDCWGPWQL